MTHREGFMNGNGTHRVFYQCWLPDAPLRALLLVVHGLAEHSGRYGHLIDHVLPLGYGVYGFDLPGHGKSDGRRVYVKRFETYTRTLALFLEKIRNLHQETPLFLFGHSMGSLISTVFLAERQTAFKGAILSGPGAVKVPENISAATIFAGRVFSVLLPKIGLIGLDANLVSRDPSVVEAYVKDPLVYNGKTTARLAAEILRTMRTIPEKATAIRLPVLLLQGGADRLVDPSGATMLYKTIQSGDKTICIYDGLYHEILNEPERNRVLEDMDIWLEKHLR